MYFDWSEDEEEEKTENENVNNDDLLNGQFASESNSYLI